MEEYLLKIKPLTPLWTGNEEGKNTDMRETGIIGSLRWWYEALIRGLGESACDPTNTKCNGEKHCGACELFGCTGWARKFRLEVEFNQTIPEVGIGVRKDCRKIRKVSGFMSDGTILLKFTPLKKISSNEWAMLNSTLKIIANYGALGAHVSQGNGVIKIEENNLPKGKLNKNECKSEKEGIDSPNLKDFFFFKISITFTNDIMNLIKNNVFWTYDTSCGLNTRYNRDWSQLWNNYGFIPIAYHIRDALRRLEQYKNIRHEIFGEKGKGSKIFVSHGYKINDKTVQVRIFGYIRNNEDDKNGEIDELLKKIMSKKDSGSLNFLKDYLFNIEPQNQQKKDGIDKIEIVEAKQGNEILEDLLEVLINGV